MAKALRRTSRAGDIKGKAHVVRTAGEKGVM
jgi:hypothetical protein